MERILMELLHSFARNTTCALTNSKCVEDVTPVVWTFFPKYNRTSRHPQGISRASSLRESPRQTDVKNSGGNKGNQGLEENFTQRFKEDISKPEEFDLKKRNQKSDYI